MNVHRRAFAWNLGLHPETTFPKSTLYVQRCYSFPKHEHRTELHFHMFSIRAFLWSEHHFSKSDVKEHVFLSHTGLNARGLQAVRK